MNWYAMIALAGLLAVSVSAGASERPGGIGVYCRLTNVVKSPSQLRDTMKRMKAAGIDFILPSGKGTSGMVNWDSKVAPKAMVGDATYMDTVVKYAHAAGLKVYPVFCVCPEGGEGKPDAVLEKNPSWAWFADGDRRGYIDPGNPDARRYEASLMAELAANYDIDGISLDYMRCPNRVGYTDTGRAEFVKKYDVDLAKIVDIGSETLDTEGGKKAINEVHASARTNPIWPKWKKWRTEQLNTFMGELHAAVNKAKPGLPISSYVWGYHTYTGSFETCQDWVSWIDKGWLDWINPSGYRYDDKAFLEAARLNRAHVRKGFPFYITIGVLTSHGKLSSAAEIRHQMQMARDCGAEGLVFFTWESLEPFADEVGPDIRAWSANE